MAGSSSSSNRLLENSDGNVVFSVDLNRFDWSNYYNKDDVDLINENLNDIGYPMLAQKFHSALVDSESFLLLRPEDIRAILTDIPRGIVLKFEKAYNEWRELNSMTINSQIISQVLSDTTASSSQQSVTVQKGIIKVILQSSPEGKSFLAEIDRNKKMSPQAQDKLMTLVCSYFLKQSKDIRLKETIELAKEIHVEFDKEPVAAYCNEESKSGPLYDKLNNMKRALRAKNMMAIGRKRKQKSSDSVAPEIPVFSPDEIEANEAVKVCAAGLDLTILKQHWRLSSKVRLHALRTETDQKFTDMYAALIRPDSFVLIQIDHNVLHPTALNFRDEWNKHENELVEVLQSVIKNDTVRTMLMSIDKLSKNQKIAGIMYALHHALFSAGVSKLPDNELKYKASVPETFKFFLFLVRDEISKDDELEAWRGEIKSRNLTQQAIIVGYGSSTEDVKEKFHVIFEDIQYIFVGPNALLAAIGILLDIYHVFNVQFPSLNSTVYRFLSQKMLGIVEKKVVKKSSNKLTTLLSHFK